VPTLSSASADRIGTDAAEFLGWYAEHAHPLLTKRLDERLLAHIDDEANRLRALADAAPGAEIAFLGSTTVGKSTTINALLRIKLLPQNAVGSTTAVKVKIKHGAAKRLEVTYRKESALLAELRYLKTEWLALEQAAEEGVPPDLTALSRHRSIARCVLGLRLNHQLTLQDLDGELVPDLLAKMRQEQAVFAPGADQDHQFVGDIHAHLAGPFWAIVDTATIELPHDLLAGGLTIVDLPGTGDTDQGHLEALRTYLDRADQFVLVLGIQLVTEDVERLLLDTHLLMKLLQRRRPLVVVGTHIDNAGVPTPDALEELGLPSTLEGLSATKAVWTAKADAAVTALMFNLVRQVLPQAVDEPLPDYTARLLREFGRTEFLPLNPKAALDLDPDTAGGVSPAQVALWRELYPTEDDLGVEELRLALRGIANARQREHAEALASAAAHFAEVLTSAFERAAHATARIPTALQQEECRAAHHAAQQELNRIDASLRTRREASADALRAELQRVCDAAAEQTNAVVVHFNRPGLHWATVKASVRSPRNGVWNKVHVPNALFQRLQLRLVTERWPAIRAGIEEVLDELDRVVDAYAANLHRAKQAAPEPLRKGFAQRIETGVALLRGHATAVRARCLQHVDQAGLPVPGAVEKAAKMALAAPCAQAAGLAGAGIVAKIRDVLAGAAPDVTHATAETVKRSLLTGVAAAYDLCSTAAVGGTGKVLASVHSDIEAFLAFRHVADENATDGEEVGAILRALRQRFVPPTTAPEDDDLPPDTIRGDVPPGSALSVLIGHTAAGDQVTWEPHREGAPLGNAGFLVTGDSGNGKTQILRALISEVVAQKLPVCIFDFKNDYAEEKFAAPTGLRVHDVSRRGLPFNPLSLLADRFGEVQAIRHVHELADILARVFQLGPIQAGVLRHALATCYRRKGVEPSAFVNISDAVRVPCFDDVVECLREKPRASESLLNRLSPLFDLGLFPSHDGAETFEKMLELPMVLDLHELPNDRIKAALAEIVILRLHAHMLRGDQPRRTRRVLVFDEAWRIGRSERLQELGREARAFGVSIAVGTQFPGDIPDKMAGNLATKLMLHNGQVEHRRAVVKQLGGTGGDAARLLEEAATLQTHEGFFMNGHYAPHLRVVTLPHYRRGCPPAHEGA